MQFETVNLANNNLTGKWSHASSRKQLIIVCHGYQGSSKDPTIIAITHGLNKKGHDTFTFNFSENTGGFDIKHQVGDVAQIVNHFKDYNELILLAGSFAALTVAIATIQLSRINRLITLNGFFGQGDVGQEHRKTYIKFRVAALIIPKYRKILLYYKSRLQPERIAVPVLVIHSKVDKYVFIKQSQDFYRQVTSPKHFVELDNANHGLTSQKDRKMVVSEIDKWLKTT
ncbi:MAG: OsmC family protein [Candidatus Saccharibacteria bacterium]|nr:OsmC family protein [Candidatus Saccharibacteria bacterium]